MYFAYVPIVFCLAGILFCLLAAGVPPLASPTAPTENDEKLSTPAKQRRLSKDLGEADRELSSDVKPKGSGKAAKGKGKGKYRGKKDADKDDERGDISSDFHTERRAARVVAEDSLKYSADTVARCPLPGCDSKGWHDLFLKVLTLTASICCSAVQSNVYLCLLKYLSPSKCNRQYF